MITYHLDSNTIMQAPFVNRKDKHRIRAYNSIMQRLADRGHHVEVQILDNKVSAEFKNTIVKYWGASYQLVPPNAHRRNVSERAIRTFKANFLAILAGIDTNFPKYMWDKGWGVVLPVTGGGNEGGGDRSDSDLDPTEVEQGRAIYCDTADSGHVREGSKTAGLTGNHAVVGADGD